MSKEVKVNVLVVVGAAMAGLLVGLLLGAVLAVDSLKDEMTGGTVEIVAESVDTSDANMPVAPVVRSEIQIGADASEVQRLVDEAVADSVGGALQKYAESMLDNIDVHVGFALLGWESEMYDAIDQAMADVYAELEDRVLEANAETLRDLEQHIQDHDDPALVAEDLFQLLLMLGWYGEDGGIWEILGEE